MCVVTGEEEDGGAPNCQNDGAEAKAVADKHTHGAGVLKSTKAKKGISPRPVLVAHVVQNIYLRLQSSLAPLLRDECWYADAQAPLKQTSPPSIPVASLFPSGIYPEGERQPYTDEYVSGLSEIVSGAYDAA